MACTPAMERVSSPVLPASSPGGGWGGWSAARSQGEHGTPIGHGVNGCQWPSKMRHFWPPKMRHFGGRGSSREARPVHWRGGAMRPSPGSFGAAFGLAVQGGSVSLAAGPASAGRLGDEAVGSCVGCGAVNSRSPAAREGSGPFRVATPREAEQRERPGGAGSPGTARAALARQPGPDRRRGWAGRPYVELRPGGSGTAGAPGSSRAIAGRAGPRRERSVGSPLANGCAPAGGAASP